jgi:glycosyltransferase involved in cell wall biosynthesis
MIAGAVSKNEQFKHERIHYVGILSQRQLYALYKKSKFFIHLAWLDHCPNVVVDARACECQIICSSTGGTKEIAGTDAIILKEPEWDYTPLRLYEPPKINFLNKTKNLFNNSELDMKEVAKKYENFLTSTK